MPISQDFRIIRQEIIDRFRDFVTNVSNTGIHWGTDHLPFPQMPASYFKGPISGEPISISINDLGVSGNKISASEIYNVLVNETNKYTNIRYLHARRYLTGSGYNFDETRVANMNDTYEQNIGAVSNAGIVGGAEISASGLNNFFTNLQNAYIAKRNNTTTVTITYCHSSCHSSCHGSRGRR